MAGPPLEAAKEALTRFVGFLAPQDHVTIAIFDDETSVLYGPGPAEPEAIRHAVARIEPAGCTNLSGGWLLGRRHVEAALGDGTNRVVLFTDGQANRGIVDTSQPTALARGAAEGRVSTSCIEDATDAKLRQDKDLARSEAFGLLMRCRGLLGNRPPIVYLLYSTMPPPTRKPLYFIASSWKDLKGLPGPVRIFRHAVYVLHVFQKKSKHGIATSRRDLDLVRSRYRIAERHYVTLEHQEDRHA